MSKFSEKCKELIDANGTNVYRLSNSSNLERTSLQRMVTGKRLPQIEFVKEFCNELRISTPEEALLMELYKMEVIGEDVYRNRQYVQNLIGHLNALEKGITTPPFVSENPLEFPRNCSCNTELAIQEILVQALESNEYSKIYTNFPADQECFFHQLHLLYTKNPSQTTHIQHLIQFQANATYAFYNIKALYNILPLALSTSFDYVPWYYYSSIQTKDSFQMIFPYYIITEDQLLIISGDLQTHILHKDSSLIAAYTSEFQRILSLSKQLILQYDTPETMLPYYSQVTPPASETEYTLEVQPCFADMATENLLPTLFKRKPELLPLASNLTIHTDEFINRKMWGTFTLQGLEYFCQTGNLSGQLGLFFSPFTIEERIIGLTNFLHRRKNHHRYMLSEKLQLPNDICFEIYTKKLHIIKLSSDLKMSLLVITESSICDAFYDFIKSLAASEFILTEDESDSIIKSAIDNLKTQLY